MNVYEGSILTVDHADTVARYLVEDAGRIVFIGDDLPKQYENAQVVHLGDKALCPAFVDTHEHLASFATFNAGLNVMDARSNEEIKQLISDFLPRCKMKIVIAFGASPYSVSEGRLLNREELDAVCPDRPFFMVKYDGHACIVNTALLNKVKERVSMLRGYHPDTGEMNQEAFFAVSDYITSSLSIPDLVRNIQKAIDYLASKGIGMVHSVSGVGFAGDLDISLENWLSKSVQQGFSIRVFPQSMDIETALKRRLPRIGGCFKCALDGCFGSGDAALNAPYYNDPSNYGVLYYTDETVIDFCKRANRAGLQIEMHAIGDAAFDQAARALKAALDDYPRDDHRHGIIHACLPTEKGLNICSEYGIHLPMQTSFIDWPQEPDDYLNSILGSERAAMLNPLRTMWDKGIVLSAGSDAPCTDPNPIVWLYKACNHSTPEESLTIREALRMCTYNGAWASFDNVERGSLEVGKLADMCVLSENPYTMNAKDLMQLNVEDLILSGASYQKQKQSWITAIARGVLSRAKG